MTRYTFKTILIFSVLGLFFFAIKFYSLARSFSDYSKIEIELLNKRSFINEVYSSNEYIIDYDFRIKNNSVHTVSDVVFYTYFYGSNGDYIGSIVTQYSGNLKKNDETTIETQQVAREYVKDEVTDDFIRLYNSNLKSCNVRYVITQVKH